MNPLHKRIFEISYKNKLSHIGSCIGCVDLIDEIYEVKKEDDIFILSSGHAGVALYTILEKYYGIDAEKLFLKHGVHPNRELSDKIYCSTGSLGMGITVACGMALTDKNRDVYCLISDGEWFEGSVQESLNFIKENNLTNIKLYCNFNGYSAYSKTDVSFVTDITLKYCPWAKIYNNDLKNYPFLIGLNAHYKAISDNEWKELNETRI